MSEAKTLGNNPINCGIKINQQALEPYLMFTGEKKFDSGFGAEAAPSKIFL